MKKDTKEELLKATIRLIKKSNDICSITAREIVAQAQTNLAMINYYYGSKDKLLILAVGQIIASDIGYFLKQNNDIKNPKQELKDFLYVLGNKIVLYKKYTVATIPYLLLHDNLDKSLIIFPYIEKFYNGKKTHVECKIIAYQFIIFFQTILYRSNDFNEFINIDVFNQEQRKILIDFQVELLLKD